MSPLVRRLGVSTIAALLLITGGLKLWSSAAGVGAAGALFGAGLLVLGIGVREWIHREPKKDSDEYLP